MFLCCENLAFLLVGGGWKRRKAKAQNLVFVDTEYYSQVRACRNDFDDMADEK